ncbi:hypothetical protein [Arthrobacter sp. S39]|uniref:hypothetical protein n=1 Tax=Arthrobacter sp. S39 TaxID=2509720 RepID=UPI001A93C538|nr:hypothetical protein [Arthrobacter sp. S39]
MSILTIPAAGYVSDVTGRKRTVLISSVGCSLTLFGYLWAISTADVLMSAVFAFLQ